VSSLVDPGRVGNWPGRVDKNGFIGPLYYYSRPLPPQIPTYYGYCMSVCTPVWPAHLQGLINGHGRAPRTKYVQSTYKVRTKAAITRTQAFK